MLLLLLGNDRVLMGLGKGVQEIRSYCMDG